MKRYIRKIALFLGVLLACGSSNTKALASQATSYTYTLDEKGEYIRTQDAYLPDKTITDLGLSKPEDLYIDDNNMLYIADTGNKRIVKYSIDKGTLVGSIEHNGFSAPKGVYVTKKGDIYVADSGAKKVFRFDAQFNFIEEFGKPSTPVFSDTNFEPMRIAVDNSGNIYLVGEGVYNGIIQLSYTGEFLGYFTVNKTRLTVTQALQKLIFTRAQLANLVDTVPTTFSNIFIDKEGIVYTTTIGSMADGVKKHNTGGGNMFKETVYGIDSMTDVYVDSQGIIYVSTSYGYISVYSPQGEWIFNFGSGVTELDVAGLFTTLPSIAVDNNRNLWCVDGDRGYLQSFQPTDYSLMVYDAMGLYEQGLYEEALNQWTEVLKLNQMSVLAHNGVGKAYLRAQEYEKAMLHFEVAGNRSYYSEAFWEVRNDWIQQYLGFFFFACVGFMIVSFIVKKVDKERKIKQMKQRMFDKIFQVPVLKDILYGFKIPKHPIDRYYDIRVKRKGTVLGATILYIAFFIVYMMYKTSKGFIYQSVAIEDMDINAIVIGFFVILILFILCNYLVTSINDGDGSLQQVYMIPAYASVPALVAMTAITVLSYGMTYNESFILTIILIIGVCWSLISVFIGLQTVHDYSFKETIKSIVMTVMFMLIAAVMAVIVTIMWEQLWNFLKTVGKEIVLNVF